MIREICRARFYRLCPTCRRRMRLTGTSSETFSQPPILVERYDRCPNCEAEWTYNLLIRWLLQRVYTMRQPLLSNLYQNEL
jgi:hypothetical protein